MHIGIDCRLWNETGVGRYIRNLVRELADIDSKNTYTLFFCKKEFDTVVIPEGNFTKALLDIRWHTLIEQLKLPRVLEKYQLDLMHFPYFSVPIGYRKPYVVTIHDLIIDHFPTGQASTLPLPLYQIKHFSYKQIVSIAAKHAKAIITPSHATKEEIMDHYKISDKKIIVTYEGVDTHINPASTKSIYEFEYFLYVGNAYPHKNLKRLLQAYMLVKEELLKKRHSGVRLVLVGKKDAFYRHLEQMVIDLDVQHDVVFAGYVDDTTLASLYDHARAVIVPSLMEGFALPALEALSRGSVVIASDIPVIREVCKDVVFYFDPMHVESIKDRMLDVIVSSQKVDKAKQKGKEISSIYSWKTMAQKTLKIYEKAARE